MPARRAAWPRPTNLRNVRLAGPPFFRPNVRRRQEPACQALARLISGILSSPARSWFYPRNPARWPLALLSRLLRATSGRGLQPRRLAFPPCTLHSVWHGSRSGGSTGSSRVQKQRSGKGNLDHDRQTAITGSHATRERRADRPRRSAGGGFHPGCRRSGLHADAGRFRRRSHQDREP